MKNFISAHDVTDIDSLVRSALAYKADPLKDHTLGAHKRVGMLFLNPSMRTRLSSQIAAQNLGAEAIVFNVDKEGWALEFEEEAIMSGNTVEHVKDAAPIMGNYFDILCIRTFPSLKNKEDDYSELYIKQFIKYSGIPVVSLESATLHPLQSLTDIVTITETLAGAQGRRPKIVLTWAPHVKALPQCVANSFSQWVNAWGKADFVIAHPEDYANWTRSFTKECQDHVSAGRSAQRTRTSSTSRTGVPTRITARSTATIRNGCSPMKSFSLRTTLR